MNNNVIIDMISNETLSQYNQRIEYIRKLEKANVVWKEANRLSIIWYYIKFFNCKYNQTLYYKIISYDKL